MGVFTLIKDLHNTIVVYDKALQNLSMSIALQNKKIMMLESKIRTMNKNIYFWKKKNIELKAQVVKLKEHLQNGV